MLGAHCNEGLSKETVRIGVASVRGWAKALCNGNAIAVITSHEPGRAEYAAVDRQ